MDIKWNMGDLLDAVARVVPPGRPAIIQGERVVSWTWMPAATAWPAT